MIKDLEAAIGYRFKNITLLQNALTHSSYANERWHDGLMSNERLEFLGDSILGMVVADTGIPSWRMRWKALSLPASWMAVWSLPGLLSTVLC